VHPIVPIMLYDAQLSQDMAAELLGEGIYVIGLATQWSQRDRPAFVFRSRRHIREHTLTRH